ncbi:unnamed protein product, partial [marine sediment metagenome]
MTSLPTGSPKYSGVGEACLSIHHILAILVLTLDTRDAVA